ncbi:MAG: DoxX family membrane protein [Gammaproteobacteria bacterium]|nr:DoxX family membrane protein [Gammaproteobacteria bacterium]
MRVFSLLLLRVSLGFLLVLWGLDKLVNVEHGLAISQKYYLGLFSGETMMLGFGVIQTLLGVLVVIGLWRRFTFPAQTLINGFTVVGVWKSIIDPWGWFLSSTNVLFYPSVIVFAACLVLWAFCSEDHLAVDHKLKGAK